jgi:putative transposase
LRCRFGRGQLIFTIRIRFEHSCIQFTLSPENVLHESITEKNFSFFHSIGHPRVSNDNPFIESFFKTLKYTAGYPGRFRDIEHAKEWMADFINWYNTVHLHSILGYVTPQQRRTGADRKLFSMRNETGAKARIAHTERWGSRPTLQWISESGVTLNPIPERKSV